MKNSHSDIRCHWRTLTPLLPGTGQERAVPGEPHYPKKHLLRGLLLAWATWLGAEDHLKEFKALGWSVSSRQTLDSLDRGPSTKQT